MNLRSIFVWVGGILMVAAAYRSYGWPGVALVTGGIVFWLLIHFNRTLQALRRAANRPIGHVDSAVMLNAKLKPGQTLLHVIALTRSLGELQSPKDTQPEVFRWTDTGDSHVTCTFVSGKLTHFALVRPEEAAPAPT